ncbi:glycoside hydrolase family 2 TIM barrel-domain containing protein [Paenibacillus sp. DYY-L-2]|uniref:glycoside hydrolase family 2 TIM barrel-domain containing protein n=1 Tax=Paenibacillus sp. DYY-L-2 TaxID=3447013 RepID=UPI003F5077E1
MNQVQLQLLVERNGQTIWEGSRTASFPCRTIPLSDIALADVELWHFDHPHLYELTIRVKEGDRIHDEVKVKLGFREFRASGNRLLLNGEPVRLVGVEWMPGSHPMKGMAESEKDRERVLEQLKHANCVLTRFHWQQDDKLLEWCDRNGILVQEELPLWQQPFEPGEETMPVAKQQIFETISRHRHHPSVIAWGMGNELDGQSEQTQKFVQQLKSYTLELDPTRMVNYVSNTVHLEPSKDATGAGDVIMWNDYIGTWHGEHNMEEVIEKLGAAYPDKPIVVAEFGLCEPAFSGGDPKRIEILLEKTEVYRRHPNIAGFIFFSLNDYRTQMGEDGVGRLRQRVHGVTDLYGVEKPSYQLLRQTASPLILETTHNEGTGDLICKFICKKDLPSYSVTGYSLSVLANPEDSEARYDIPPMEPGSSCEMIIPTKGLSGQVRLAIHRPTGFSVLERIVDL